MRPSSTSTNPNLRELALLALIPVWLYNGEQGPHNKTIRRACYAFYPVHMLILAVLWLYVLN